MTEYSDRAPGYLSTYGAISDPRMFLSMGLLNEDLYAATCHTCLERDAMAAPLAILQVESTNNLPCGTSQSTNPFTVWVFPQVHLCDTIGCYTSDYWLGFDVGFHLLLTGISDALVVPSFYRLGFSIESYSLGILLVRLFERPAILRSGLG